MNHISFIFVAKMNLPVFLKDVMYSVHLNDVKYSRIVLNILLSFEGSEF